jgi:branched-chain amino acid transport system ATP-binding protein
MLELRRVGAGYGRAQVLFDFDLAIARGEVLALLGRNGAGKSTVLKAVMGLVERRAGEVTFDGRSLDGLPPYRVARLGLGYVPEERRIFDGLTVQENLEAGRQPEREAAPFWTLSRVFELFPSLGRMRERRGGRLSGGEQQMLAIARSLMGNPRVILLDEPFEGLAPLIVEAIAQAIGTLKREGLSVLLCDQNLRFARRIAERAVVIEQGRACYAGSLAALDADAELRERVLAL